MRGRGGVRDLVGVVGVLLLRRPIPLPRLPAHHGGRRARGQTFAPLDHRAVPRSHQAWGVVQLVHEDLARAGAREGWRVLADQLLRWQVQGRLSHAVFYQTQESDVHSMPATCTQCNRRSIVVSLYDLMMKLPGHLTGKMDRI